MKTLRKWRKTLALSTTLVGLGLSTSVAAAGLTLPTWEDVFNPDGTVKQSLSDGGKRDAIFMSDRLSLGAAVDNSTIISGPTIEETSVDNAPVSVSGDLGNAYAYARTNLSGSQELFIAVERIASAGQITIELHKELVYVTHGRPWPMSGARSNGDLAVQLTLDGSLVSDAVVMEWADGAYQVVTQSDSAAQCVGDSVSMMSCVGAPSLITNYEEYADSMGNLLGSEADQLVEVGLNIDLLTGTGTHYSSILIYTNEDLIMSQFNKHGYWAYE